MGVKVDLEKMKSVRLSDNCTFNHRIGIIINDGEEIELTDYASKALSYLIANNGIILSADQILDHCFGVGCYTDAKQSVKSIIAQIRAAIGDKKRTILCNKYGAGYYIDIPEQSENNCEKAADDSRDNAGTSQFEAELINNSKILIDMWEGAQDYEIDQDLLASCTVKGQDYENLYEYVKEAVNQEKHRNCIVQATGGSGKTSSLVYTCKKFIDETESVIPIFVQMRKLDMTLEKPITSYIYNNYVHKMDFSMPHELENQFLHNLGEFLIETNKQLLVILDGCNETAGKGMNGIKDIISLPNTIVIASSRLKDENMNEFLTIRLHSLDKNTAIKYLNKFNILLGREYDNDNLRLPIFIYMYAQICRDKQDSQEKMADIINQAAIIKEWINHDLRENKKITHLQDAESEFAVEYFLPLLAMVMFFEVSYEEHVSLYVNKKDCLRALKVVSSILKDEDIQDSIDLERGWSVENFNLKKCLNDIVVNRFAFLQREDSEEYLFSWSHECYRDWFIAKGLDVLRQNSKSMSREYLTRFVEDVFRYPRVFQRKDFSAYSVAVYYAELIGEKILTSINDVCYHKLIRNIAFFADDIGNAKHVLDYSRYITERDANEHIETPKLQKALALSGMAYAMLHTYNVNEREDNDQIAGNALEMLTEAKKSINDLLGITFDNLEISEDNLMSIPPECIEAYFKFQIECEQFNKLKKLETTENMDFDFNSAIACLSRIYGNLGSYYINRYDATKNEDTLLDAHKMHILGGLIKYYILCDKHNEKIDGRATGEAMAISYRSMGIDLFRSRNYANSVAYLEYARDNFDISDDVHMVIEEYIIRSKVADILFNGISCSIKDIIMREKIIVRHFKKTKMVGELERITYVVAEMIDVCKKTIQDSDTEKELLELIDMLDKIFDSFSLEDNLKNKMINYWKNGGENLWKKNYE